ncbi:hypothetical protein F5Y07DRAFT_175814 [Xylaria sp. FL0933]|nr:hypothetical protein F5Y07DRAFT_175814 [Xylaria sp. FL0933]
MSDRGSSHHMYVVLSLIGCWVQYLGSCLGMSRTARDPIGSVAATGKDRCGSVTLQRRIRSTDLGPSGPLPTSGSVVHPHLQPTRTTVRTTFSHQVHHPTEKPTSTSASTRNRTLVVLVGTGMGIISRLPPLQVAPLLPTYRCYMYLYSRLLSLSAYTKV